jgi:hypothetical protein
MGTPHWGGRPMSRTGARITKAAELRREALYLRNGGASFAAIGKTLGVSKSAAFKAINSALQTLRDEITEQAKLLQCQEADRLDQMQMGVWTRAIGGDLPAIQTVLKIMERRAKLLGLDSPIKVAETHPDGSARESDSMSRQEREARIAELEAKRRGPDTR